MFIPYGKHTIDQEDIKAVVEALQENYITTGPGVERFEKEFADYVGVKYAVAVSSGTAALHTACAAIGIQAGDEVITSSITFISSSNGVLYCGGIPVFADIDEKTYNIDPEDIRKKITPKTKAIIPVHFTGQACNMDQIHEIAKEHGLYVIEDGAHAIGTEYKGKRVGGLSDLTIFSFHPVKHMTTCEGGIITTNNEELYKKMKQFRAYCITKDPDLLVNKQEGPWHWEIHDLGYNYRLSDVACALGSSQLKKMDKFLERRREIAAVYNEKLVDLEEIVLPFEDPVGRHGWHLYTIQIKNGRRREVYTKMREVGIGVEVHYLPVYKHPYYQRIGYQNVCCKKAEALYENILSIPIYYTLTDEQQQYVIDILHGIFN